MTTANSVSWIDDLLTDYIMTLLYDPRIDHYLLCWSQSWPALHNGPVTDRHGDARRGWLSTE